MLLRYLYTISKLCALISNFVFFDIGVSLSDPAWAAVAPTRYWTQIAVCAHCIANQSLPVAHAPPGPPSAAAAEPTLGGAATPAAPAAATGAEPGPAEYVAGPSGATLGLGPAEYVKLNLVPESQWPSWRSARFPSRRIVNHNHGLNHGSSQSSHGGGVLVMLDTRNHQRNAGACDSILRENDGLAPSLG
jgi:hypothetical protein